MRAPLVSFTRGEVSPLLRCRVDLAAYHTGAAKLRNFIPLPQGGIARRPGFVTLGAALRNGECALVPFSYSRDNSMVIELSDRRFRVWDVALGKPVCDGVSPYSASQLADLKWSQSGNWVFFAHREVQPQILKRLAYDEWEWEPLGNRNGPWLSERGAEGVKLRVSRGQGGVYYTITANTEYFEPSMTGRLIEINYNVKGASVDGEARYSGPAGSSVRFTSDEIEVGGEWNLNTKNSWTGTVTIERRVGDGQWITVRTLTRLDANAEANFDVAGAETESGIYYRFIISVTSGQCYAVLTAAGFTKANIFKIRFVAAAGSDGRTATAEWVRGDNDTADAPITGLYSTDWRLGAWGNSLGWPAAVTHYQGRLVYAGGVGSPLSVWMSVVDDFNNFAVHDPVRDDDAITATLASGDADGIHSLLSMQELIAFTAAGEWRINGSGENGSITPSAVVAHRQDNVGSAPIQPLLIRGEPVYVQRHRKSLHAMKYALDMDGYTGSELSVMSSHLFGWKQADGHDPDKRILGMAYQAEPDSLIWLVLADGMLVSCTYMPEHEVCAWARHDTVGGIRAVCSVPGPDRDELWAVVLRDDVNMIERLASREAEDCFLDAGTYIYTSEIDTLRLSVDQAGQMMTAKKLVPRVSVFAIRSNSAYACPASDVNHHRRREIRFRYDDVPVAEDIALDSGFEAGAALHIYTIADEPLTIAAVVPQIFAGTQSP